MNARDGLIVCISVSLRGSEACLALLDRGLELPLHRRPRRRHYQVLPCRRRAVGVELADAVGLVVQAAHPFQAADLSGIHQQAALAVLPSYQLRQWSRFLTNLILVKWTGRAGLVCSPLQHPWSWCYRASRCRQGHSIPGTRWRIACGTSAGTSPSLLSRRSQLSCQCQRLVVYFV